MSVSVATIYKLCARGLLRHVRVLSAIRIPESALDGLSHKK
ncbi:MAG: helix-turn-helix domain-containing protein [Deltaproteobacteria bacterium]|nr:helix-turn-helix domain-containing protein [Deltaproteobacteria bacterium]